MDRTSFEKFSGECFIKSSDAPKAGIEGTEKVKLNRKGNELLNGGDLETARRIFQTTGYFDGLIRVGERYLAGGRPVDALKMFWLARDEARVGELAEKAAQAIRKMLQEEEV